MLRNFGDNLYKSAMMMPLNFAKLTLFFVVLTSLATSQPFSRSHGAASRHTGFQWNTRKVGNKNVATISKRRDEERDRRSVPLADADSTFHKAFGSHSSEVPLDSERRHHNHHHQHHHQQHHHRHHHGEEEEAIKAADDVEVVNDGGGRGEEEEEEEEEEREIRGNRRSKGKGRHRTRLDSSEILEEEEEEEAEEEDKSLNIFSLERLPFSGAPPGELRMPEGVDTRRLQEILASTGLETDADVFKNVTTPAPDGQESNEGGRQGGKKNKKRSKKVKRERRKRNKGKKGKKGKKNNPNGRKCRHLKGKQKKQCRTEANMFSFIKENISMSGNDACQYHNLEECCRKVGFLGLDTDELPAVRKCHYRKQFLDCMEEQRKATCDPNFETRGDMKALRMKIRNVIWTTDSCLISEVVEG